MYIKNNLYFFQKIVDIGKKKMYNKSEQKFNKQIYEKQTNRIQKNITNTEHDSMFG